MESKRQELHKIVDELPEDVLDRAEQALRYCANPAQTQFTLAQARRRVREMSLKRLEEHSKQTGRGFVFGSGSTSRTTPTGDFSSSMTAWDNGPITYHLRRFSGHQFEVYERLELATDGRKLVLSQRIVGPDGAEQLLTANMPIADSAAG
jgi:hypothetical protein